MEDTVQLSSLLDSVLQKAYGDLTNLTELLPRKTDVDRKLEIVQYTRHTRQLLIRILALVKWTKISEPVHQCAEVSAQINHHAWVFVDSADQLAHLARNTLQQAGMPNFSLAPAIDVLTMGSYPRLPTCIRDRIILPPTLTLEEKQTACFLLESIIRYRLSLEPLPPSVHVTDISKGRVTLKVPYEFEAVLTVVGDDITLPWRLLELKILVGEALSGSPVLVTRQQSYYLHQVVQSRLCAEDGSLKDMFLLLHHFSLSLQLDCLHAQVERLSVAVCGIYIKIEEYIPARQLRVGYWMNARIGSGDYMGPPASPFITTEVISSPKLIMSINPHSADKPFITTHIPPLPTGDVSLSVHPHHLSFQELLVQCVRVRSLALLKEFVVVLSHTPWEQHSVLLHNPPCLKVYLQTSLSSDTLLLSVDCRLGQVVASLESGNKPSEQVVKALLMIEHKVLTDKAALPHLIGNLLSELCLTHITSLAKDYNLPVKRSLPLSTPISLEPLLLYIKLERGTYLVANIKWLNHALQEKYNILRVVPCAILPTSPMEDIPKSFMKPVSLIEVEAEKVLTQLTGSLLVKKSSARLKRKLQTHPPLLPSVKRLCVCPSSILPSLPGLLTVTERLSHLRSSLTAANLSALSISSGGLGSPHIEIFNMPRTHLGGSLLSSLLCSYELWPHPDHVHSKIIFSDVLDPRSQAPVIIHNTLPYQDIGSKILKDWKDKRALLALTLELHSFLKQDKGSTYCDSSGFDKGGGGRIDGGADVSFDEVSNELLRNNSTKDKTSLLLYMYMYTCTWALTRDYTVYMYVLLRLHRDNACSCIYFHTNKLQVLIVLYNYPVHHSIEYCELGNRCSIRSYTYENLCLTYEEYSFNIHAVGEGVVMDCPAPSPHHYLSSTLQQYLYQSQSLPLLLKGMCSTKEALKDLWQAFKSFSNTKLSGVAPSYIRLTRELISLDILLLRDNGVAFRGVTWEKDSLPAIVSQPSMLILLRSFLSLQIQGKIPDNLREETHSLPLPSKPSLGPSPLPITSPLPSIPSLPPPTNTQPLVGVVSTGSPVWEHILTKHEWQKLLKTDSEKMCVLERFLGSLSLLVQWIKDVSTDKNLQPQMTYMSVDRGVFTYHVDVLSVTVGLDPSSSLTSMVMKIKTLQDGVWTEKELQTLTDFFNKHVVKPPYLTRALSAFLQLFCVSRIALKSCIQIMQLQMQPSSEAIWRVQICLCVPNGIDLGDIAKPGSAGIIVKGKLLLFLSLIRQKDQHVLNIPILHDPKTNLNYVARKTSYPKPDLSAALNIINQTLRKPSQEWNIPPNESSLAYCIQDLLKVNLPV